MLRPTASQRTRVYGSDLICFSLAVFLLGVGTLERNALQGLEQLVELVGEYRSVYLPIGFGTNNVSIDNLSLYRPEHPLLYRNLSTYFREHLREIQSAQWHLFLASNQTEDSTNKHMWQKLVAKPFKSWWVSVSELNHRNRGGRFSMVPNSHSASVFVACDLREFPVYPSSLSVYDGPSIQERGFSTFFDMASLESQALRLQSQNIQGANRYNNGPNASNRQIETWQVHCRHYCAEIAFRAITLRLGLILDLVLIGPTVLYINRKGNGGRISVACGLGNLTCFAVCVAAIGFPSDADPCDCSDYSESNHENKQPSRSSDAPFLRSGIVGHGDIVPQKYILTTLNYWGTAIGMGRTQMANVLAASQYAALHASDGGWNRTGFLDG